MPRLGALAELDLDHLDLLVLRAVAEAFGVEAAACIAAAEIAAAELPHDVAAVGAMIGAEAAFAGVVVEIRSEERRVGKDCGGTCRSWGSPYKLKKKIVSNCLRIVE